MKGNLKYFLFFRLYLDFIQTENYNNSYNINFNSSNNILMRKRKTVHKSVIIQFII